MYKYMSRSILCICNVFIYVEYETSERKELKEYIYIHIRKRELWNCGEMWKL